MTLVCIWFYNPQKDEQGFLNKVIAYADPPFCHCEMQFEDEMACSIYMGTTVVFKKRSFDVEYYTPVYLNTTQNQAHHAYKLCHDAATNQTQFSSMQMLACIAPWPWGRSNEKFTYCSKLIAGILIDSNIVPSDMERLSTPSHLFRNLRDIVAQESRVHDVIEILPSDLTQLRI